MSETYRSMQTQLAFDMWQMEMAAIVIGGCILILAVVLIWRNRRRIARAADEAAVATLATGVRTGRKIGERAATYRQRIIDRAGAEPPAR